jgi:hypothetical protein
LVKDWNKHKGYFLNFSIVTNPSAFKEIKMKNCWINNNLEIWNYLTVLFGLKVETAIKITVAIANEIKI